MVVDVTPASLADVSVMRGMYRSEMDCQIIHDSIHQREGWSEEYLLTVSGVDAGYGSVAVGGPWAGQPTLYEIFVLPAYRLHFLDICRTLLDRSAAVAMEVQSNDPLGTTALHAFAREVGSLSVLFKDWIRTSLAPAEASFRMPEAAEAPDLSADRLRWHGVVAVGGQIAARGGILFHYNPPYGDIYMEVAEPFRRRGLGSFLVQELKRVCYEEERIPGARCDPANIASRRTLQKAGFIPCGHILRGKLP